MVRFFIQAAGWEPQEPGRSQEGAGWELGGSQKEPGGSSFFHCKNPSQEEAPFFIAKILVLAEIQGNHKSDENLYI